MDPYAGPFSELLAEEQAGMGQARAERILEFQAGRHCARAAMSSLGLPPRAVGRAADRSPVWPEGLVGSITHTRRGGRGWCGAVVARSSDVRALGLDAELDEPLEESLFARVLTAEETRVVSALEARERGRHAKLVFSAKECTYKCQHPLSRTFLEFGDVEVELGAGDELFSARLLRDAPPFLAGYLFLGRFARRDGVIVTGITLRHDA